MARTKATKAEDAEPKVNLETFTKPVWTKFTFEQGDEVWHRGGVAGAGRYRYVVMRRVLLEPAAKAYYIQTVAPGTGQILTELVAETCLEAAPSMD